MLNDIQIEERRNYITASEVAAVVGVCPYSTPWDVWDRKINGTRVEPTLAMKLGSALQKPFLEAMSDHYEMGLTNNDYDELFFYKNLPYCAATPDGYTQDMKTLAEVKIVGPGASRKWGRTADEIPDYVYCQVQWQMGVCDADMCIVMALVWGEPRMYEIKRDDMAFGSMYLIASEFFEDYVLTGEPPPVEPKIKYVAQKTDKIITVDVDDFELRDTCYTYLSNKKTEREAKALVKGAEYILKQAIGENQGLRCDQNLFTWKADKNGKRALRVKEEK